MRISMVGIWMHWVQSFHQAVFCLFQPLQDNDDGLRGFEVEDVDGYILFFGCPKKV